MDIVEVPPVALLVTQYSPAVLAGHAVRTSLNSLDSLAAGQFILFIIVVIVLETDTHKTHGIVTVLVDLIITVNGELVLVGLMVAGDLDVVGIHHHDALVVVVTVAHLDRLSVSPSVTTKLQHALKAEPVILTVRNIWKRI